MFKLSSNKLKYNYYINRLMIKIKLWWQMKKSFNNINKRKNNYMKN